MLRLRKLFGPLPVRFEAKGAIAARTPAKIAGAADASPVVDQVVLAEGGEHFAAGRFAEALVSVDKALATTPKAPELLFARGSVLFGWRRYHEALACYRQAAEAGLDHVDLDLQTGWSCVYTAKLEEAESHFRKAVAAESDSMTAYVALANVLEMRGKLAANAEEIGHGLTRWQDDYDAVILLAVCRLYQEDRDGGIAAFRRAISIDPERSRAWSNLGAALDWSREFPAAMAAFERAFELESLQGTSGNSFINLATGLREQGRRSEALELLRRTLAKNPDVNGHWLYSVILLETGAFDEGWPQHEFRWLQEPLLSRRWSIKRPRWSGQDLENKTILLHAEQGFGDTIQFIRYAPTLKALGARVLFDSFKGFEEISRDFDGVDEVLVEGGSIPQFDYHIPLLSLARVFRTDRTSAPANIPYLKVRPDYAEKWSSRIPDSGKLKVGLVWAGNPKHRRDKQRSIPLSMLKPLSDVGGVQLFGLQKGPSVESDVAASGMDLVNLDSHLRDFCDTAAAIDLLDLVISVDTSVAHLAGALGKPVWLMLPTPPDWRWLLEGRETMWYPTMRLFRQEEPHQWGLVVEQIAQSLRELALARRTDQGDKRKDAARVVSRSANDSLAAVPPTLSHPHEGLSAVEETRYGIVQFFPGSGSCADSLEHYGEYRQLELDLIGRFIKPGSWILHVGAGIGLDSLFLAGAAGDGGHVLVYEADPLVHQLARQNLAANRVRNVTLLQRRMGAEMTKSSSSGRTQGAGADDGDTIDGLRLARLDWIKIDLPEFAQRVLEGAGESLWRFRPWIFTATKGEPDLQAFVQSTRDFGYQSWRVKTPMFNPQNYNCRSDDILLDKFATGVLSIPEEIDMDIQLEGASLL
jgi:FkbM family methyltransferase